MLALYLPGIQFGRSVNIHAHATNIQAIMPASRVVTIQEKDELLRILSVTDARCIYFLAHSSPTEGMMIHEQAFVGASDILRHPCFRYHVPDQIFLNTCYGIESGLANAFLEKGVREVMAFQGEIPIRGICQRFEEFLQAYTRSHGDVRQAVMNCPEPRPVVMPLADSQ